MIKLFKVFLCCHHTTEQLKGTMLFLKKCYLNISYPFNFTKFHYTKIKLSSVYVLRYLANLIQEIANLLNGELAANVLNGSFQMDHSVSRKSTQSFILRN